MEIFLTVWLFISVLIFGIEITRLKKKLAENEINLIRLARVCDILANEINKSLNSMERLGNCIEIMLGKSEYGSNWKDAENIE